MESDRKDDYKRGIKTEDCTEKRVAHQTRIRKKKRQNRLNKLRSTRLKNYTMVDPEIDRAEGQLKTFVDQRDNRMQALMNFAPRDRKFMECIVWFNEMIHLKNPTPSEWVREQVPLQKRLFSVLKGAPNDSPQFEYIISIFEEICREGFTEVIDPENGPMRLSGFLQDQKLPEFLIQKLSPELSARVIILSLRFMCSMLVCHPFMMEHYIRYGLIRKMTKFWELMKNDQNMMMAIANDFFLLISYLGAKSHQLIGTSSMPYILEIIPVCFDGVVTSSRIVQKDSVRALSFLITLDSRIPKTMRLENYRYTKILREILLQNPMSDDSVELSYAILDLFERLHRHGYREASPDQDRGGEMDDIVFHQFDAQIHLKLCTYDVRGYVGEHLSTHKGVQKLSYILLNHWYCLNPKNYSRMIPMQFLDKVDLMLRERGWLTYVIRDGLPYIFRKMARWLPPKGSSLVGRENLVKASFTILNHDGLMQCFKDLLAPYRKEAMQRALVALKELLDSHPALWKYFEQQGIGEVLEGLVDQELGSAFSHLCLEKILEKFLVTTEECEMEDIAPQGGNFTMSTVPNQNTIFDF